MGAHQRDRGQTRLATLLVVMVAVGLIVLLSGLLWAFRGRAPAGPATAPHAARLRDAAVSREAARASPPGLAELHAWDARRAAAWAAGDAAALRRLYVAGSATGRADVAMLRSYAARGLVVAGLREQVLAVRVLRADGDRLELRVTERLAAATATGSGVRRNLPRGQPARHIIELWRLDGRWRVAEVRAAG